MANRGHSPVTPSPAAGHTADMAPHSRLALALTVAVAVVVSACSSGPGPVETGPAADAHDEIIDRAGAEPGGFIDLERCPHDPGGALLTGLIDGLESPDGTRALGEELEPVVSWFNPDLPQVLACDRFGEVSGVGLVITEAPADFDAYIEAFVEGDDGNSLELQREGTSEHRGGTFHRICAIDPGGDGFDYCEVDWLDDRLLITVYIQGPQSTETDLDALEGALADALDDITTNLAGAGDTRPA